MKDLLTLKTGELIARTEDLREANESLNLLNKEVSLKTEEVKKTKKDLTDTEKRLVIVNDELAETNKKFVKTNDDLARVNKEIITANEQIRQLAIRQKEFIDITAHELRTPIQAILGYAELMSSEPNANTEYIKFITRNAIRIQRLVSNILEMAKIENNILKLSKEDFNLMDLISLAVQDIQSQISSSSSSSSSDKKSLNKKRFYVKYIKNEEKAKDKEDVIIKADKEKIFQVITNLLDNAVKFTEKGNIVITVSRNLVNKDDGKSNWHEEIVVKVKDVGMGIDPKAHSKVFSKFYTASEAGGTGLGLYICKVIIEAHGGRIWVENNPDERGATFSFSIPLNQA